MRKAVSWSDYEKYGCVECGCDYAYNSSGIKCGGTNPVKCGECNTEFIILADGVKVSAISFGTGKADKDGKAILETPVLVEHPRKGIEKHKYVRPDVRPENGAGEFANPRGVGYDVACFVKSKEAGTRIVEMFKKIAKEYEEKGKKFGFSCRLDYRPDEPNWIQTKIDYPNEDRAELLCALIRYNGNIITEDVIKSANDMRLSAVDRYKLFGINSLLLNYSFMNKLNILVNNYGSRIHDRERVEELYELNYNLLAQFEMFGTGLQVHNAIYGNDIQTGMASLLNFIDKYNDTYTCQMRFEGVGEEKKKWQVNSNGEIKDYINAAIEVCNSEPSKNKIRKIRVSENTVPSDFKQIDIQIEKDQRYDFRAKFLRELEPLIIDYVDWSFMKKVLSGVESICLTESVIDKEAQLKIAELINTSKNKNFIAMFSLAGLLYQVHGELDREYDLGDNVHFTDAILATSHTFSQLESPIVSKIEESKNNEEKNSLYEQIKSKLQELCIGYGTISTGEKKTEKPAVLKR